MEVSEVGALHGDRSEPSRECAVIGTHLRHFVGLGRTPLARSNMEQEMRKKGLNEGTAANGECHDDVARKLACAAIYLWGNLVSVTVDTLVISGLPPSVILAVLERLDAENRGTLQPEHLEVALELTATIRARLSSND